jgi:hypothetical protein
MSWELKRGRDASQAASSAAHHTSTPADLLPGSLLRRLPLAPCALLLVLPDGLLPSSSSNIPISVLVGEAGAGDTPSLAAAQARVDSSLGPQAGRREEEDRNKDRQNLGGGAKTSQVV